MKKVLKFVSVILYIACLITITCGLAVYSIHTFSFKGRFTKYLALEPYYYYYEPLVDDYIKLLKADKCATALSCIEPALLEYYSSKYQLNKDIIMTLDDAYTDDIYSFTDSWYIHHTIEWNINVYQDLWDKFQISPDKGVDLYVRLEGDNSQLIHTYIFEVIQCNGFWYLLSVTPE